MSNQPEPKSDPMSQALQEAVQAHIDFQKEFNDLLIALGATSQVNLSPGPLTHISKGYRNWLAQKSPQSLCYVKPPEQQQYWYAIFECIQPNGAIIKLPMFLKEHPLSTHRTPVGAFATFFCEIPEKVYSELANREL